MGVVAARHVIFGNVSAENNGFVGQESQFFQNGQNRVAFCSRERADGLTLFKMLEKRFARLGLGTDGGLRLGFLSYALIAAL